MIASASSSRRPFCDTNDTVSELALIGDDRKGEGAGRSRVELRESAKLRAVGKCLPRQIESVSTTASLDKVRLLLGPSQNPFLPGLNSSHAAECRAKTPIVIDARRNKFKNGSNSDVGVWVHGRRDEWTDLMRSAIAGDGTAYHNVLKAVTPVLRAIVARGLARAGQPADQSEDIVQEILLAVHLKRHTWNIDAPLAPWLFAIARNKLIDALRRRGKRIFVNIDDLAETLPGEAVNEAAPAGEVEAHLRSLPVRQREILQSIAVESASIRETATKFSMTEGAVRVALHRGLASLTAKLRES